MRIRLAVALFVSLAASISLSSSGCGGSDSSAGSGDDGGAGDDAMTTDGGGASDVGAGTDGGSGDSASGDDASTDGGDGATSGFKLGGTVQGLFGSVVLRNGPPLADAGAGDASADGGMDAGVPGDFVTVSTNGAFAFPTNYASGTAYDVTVFTQPTWAHCAMFASSDGGVPGVGVIGNANVTTLDVRCAGTPTPTTIAACTNSPTFSWSPITGASYTLEYGLQGGAMTQVDLGVGVTMYSPGSPLAAGTYDWHVRSMLNGVVSDWSPTSSFTAGTLGSFSQTLTADFAANTNTNVVISGDQVALDSLGDGSEGAYAPSSNTTIAGGEHKFTSIHIPSGVTVTVIGTSPLVLRSTGSVVIDGVLDASGPAGANAVTFSNGGTGGLAVAGGSNGGDGIFNANTGPIDGNDGFGSGAGGKGKGWSGGGGGGYGVAGGSSGAASGGAAGAVYGSANLATFVGGSGGGSGSGGNNCGSGGGGAGGGAIRIFGSSISVSATGAIHADGGHGGSDGTGNCGGGGGGSGGAVWLSSTSTVVVDGNVTASGGAGGSSSVAGTTYFGAGAAGGAGRVRIDGTFSGAGTVSPASGYNAAAANSGTSITPLIQPTNECAWGTLTFHVTTPTNTTATVDVLDSTNAVIAANVASGTSLRSLSAVNAVSAIKLRVNLARTANDVTPLLLDWSVGYATN